VQVRLKSSSCKNHPKCDFLTVQVQNQSTFSSSVLSRFSTWIILVPDDLRLPVERPETNEKFSLPKKIYKWKTGITMLQISNVKTSANLCLLTTWFPRHYLTQALSQPSAPFEIKLTEAMRSLYFEREFALGCTWNPDMIYLMTFV
jgi:hypothetical protein